PLVGADHVELLDGLGDLVAAEAQEVLDAEVGVVAADVDDGRAAADGALHAAPPEITGLISTTSSSSSTPSPGTKVSPLITSTDSRFSSSRWSSTFTLVGPGMSSSRRGFRRITFTGQPRGWSVWVMRSDWPGCSSSRSAISSWLAFCW